MVGRDGLPVLVGGFCPVRAGVYEGWLAGTPQGWANHWRAMTKVCCGLMDDLLSNGAHRIETFAHTYPTVGHFKFFEQPKGRAAGRPVLRTARRARRPRPRGARRGHRPRGTRGGPGV